MGWSRFARWMVCGPMLVLALLSGGCSKENAVAAGQNQNTYVGKKCTSDSECGGGSCIAGKCRSGCATDADCQADGGPGAICIADGNLTGCRLPDEEECSTSKPCPGGLVCAIDKSCRTVCGAGVACPQQGQTCIAGACVNQSEQGASDTWFSCNTGDKFCSSEDVIGCNTVAPGWGKEQTCMAPTVCEDGACKETIEAGPEPLPEAGPEPQPETGPTCDAPNTLCGSTCTNLSTDVDNCGTCDHACPATPDHGTSRCVGGQCGVTCDTGFGDCDHDPANGCEVDVTSSSSNCGSCGNACPATVPNGSTICDQSKCAPVCDSDHANCDSSLSNGCETDIRQDANHCGSCSTVCSTALPHAVGQCSAKSCGATCDTDWGDCDADMANGCETSLLNTNAHCGACGNPCGTGEFCSNGACGPDPHAPVQVSSGGAHTCAVLGSGELACWGYNAWGQLGNNSTQNHSTPQMVSGISNAVQVSAGESFSCARLVSGQVMCWGYNGTGNLGTGNTSNSSVPVYVSGITNAVDIDCANMALQNSSNPNNQELTCAVLAEGTVWCWGTNGNGELGSNAGVSSSVPVQVPGITDAVDVEAAHSFACARRSNGHVSCWGYNAQGQLGNGSTSSSPTSPVEVTGLTDAVQLDLAYTSQGGLSCARRQNGSIVCWGALAALGMQNATTPTTVPGAAASSTLALGYWDLCLVQSSDGTPRCWGANSNGQLGDGTWTNRASPTQPVDVLSGTPIGATSGISVGSAHACLVTSDGKARCTGWNAYGQLGDGQLFPPSDRNRVVPVVDIGPMSVELGRCADGVDNDADGKIDGEDPDCATDLGSATGTMLATANNSDGALGNYFRGACGGDGRDRILRWTAPSSGTFRFASDSTATDTVIHAYDGAMNGLALGCSSTGIVASLTAGQQVFVALDFNSTSTIGASQLTVENITCDSNHADCDGNSANGCESRLDTVQHCGSCSKSCTVGQWCNAGNCAQDAVAEVSSGGAHTLARMSSGLVYAWGYNAWGQLGNSSTQNLSAPVMVQGITNAAQVSAGESFSCARLATGRVECWGYNGTGDLGTGNTSSSSVPVYVSGITSAVDIDCANMALQSGVNPNSQELTCAALADGTVWCWGTNGNGELGSNAGVSSTVPVQVPGITDAVDVEATHSFACARRSNGHVSCWGYNAQGQLGNGSTSTSPTSPVEVTGLTDAVQLDLAYTTQGGLSCARRQNGSIVCWGAVTALGQSASSVPAPLPGYTGIASFSLGYSTLCAFDSGSAQLWCSGANNNGIFGRADLSSSSVPVAAESLLPDGLATGITGVSAGVYHMCAVRGPTLLCSGWDGYGQLGDGQRANAANRAPMVPVLGPSSIPMELGLCADGVDNDGDGKIDEQDPDCASNLGTAVGSDLAVYQAAYAQGNYFTGTCGGEGREHAFLWTAPSTGSYTFSTTGSTVDTVLYLHDVGISGPELACNDSAGPDSITRSVTAGHTVVVFTDTKPGTDSGTIHLSIGP